VPIVHSALSAFTCVACGADYDDYRRQCCNCGAVGSLIAIQRSRRGKAYGGADYQPRPRRRPATKSLPALIDQHRPRLKISWAFLDLPPTARAQAEGLPGSGKSTMATGAAISVAHSGYDCLYLAVEEGQGDTLVDRFERQIQAMGCRPPSALRIADVRDPEEAMVEIDAWRRGTGERLLVIDSLTDLGASSAWLQELMSDERLGLLLVVHNTTSKDPRGGWGSAYAVDVRIFCRDLVAEVRKNRFGPCTSFNVLMPRRLGDALPDSKVVPFPTKENKP